jgi:hypothetical protein
VSSKWLTAYPSAFLNRPWLFQKPLLFWEGLAVSGNDPGRKQPDLCEALSEEKVIREKTKKRRLWLLFEGSPHHLQLPFPKQWALATGDHRTLERWPV